MSSEYPLSCLMMSTCVGDSLYVYFDLSLGCVNLLGFGIVVFGVLFVCPGMGFGLDLQEEYW